MFNRDGYRAFIASKGSARQSVGFAVRGAWPSLFEHQRRALAFACEKGRAACFLDTGLGKSRVEAAFAEEARIETGRPTLILTPLAVARQMQRECAAVGVDARVIREAAEVWPGVNIANYERLAKLDLSRFGGVVLDESSILKSFTGTTKRALVAGFAETPYRLAATATPAPNDHMELGTHSEFLGNLGSMEMLCRWFVNDTSTASRDWRLKGHAVRDFWQWVASWARAASLPSDLGGEDAGFILPPLTYRVHETRSDPTEDTQGMLFRIPDQSATSIHKEKRMTINERVGMAAEIANADGGPVIVWCETNDESAALTRAIPDAIEVHGGLDPDAKERALDAFTFGQRRVIVTKPKLAGFGLNWQHARTVVFASISHSYEQHYQAVRRSWRFGQTAPVTAHVVIADTERPIWANVRRKAEDHDRMKRAMSAAMIEAQREAVMRVAYTRPAAVELPAFLKGRKENAA
jgi:superfamily II DNA or RNA helicase